MKYLIARNTPERELPVLQADARAGSSVIVTLANELGTPLVDVKLEVTADGFLRVSANDMTAYGLISRRLFAIDVMHAQDGEIPGEAVKYPPRPAFLPKA